MRKHHKEDISVQVGRSVSGRFSVKGSIPKDNSVRGSNPWMERYIFH
jgi:hypothetical protein